MAKNTSASKAVFVSVIALAPIEHDGVRYEKDDEFSLPADAVAHLADVNAVKVVGEAAPEAPAA